MRKYFIKALILMLCFLLTSCSANYRDYKNASILDAAANGDLDEVKRYLDDGVHVDTQDEYGHTALLFAAMKGHTDVATFLIEKNANINAADTLSKHSVLHWSAAGGHSDIVTALVNAGADINIRTIREMTPLMYAAGKGHTDVVSILIANEKCDISAVMDTGSNALIEAVSIESGNEVTVNILLDKSKVVNPNNGIKNDAEYQAYIDAKHQNTGTALMLASKNGNVENVSVLIDAGSSINLKNYEGSGVVWEGYTALMFAADYGHLDVLNKLILENASIHIKNSDGQTALMISTDREYIVNALIEKGAIVNEVDKNKNTALMIAGRWGRLKAVSLLIDKTKVIGSSTGIASESEYTTYINMKNSEGKTVLGLALLLEDHWAYNKEAIVKILREANATE